MRCYILLALCLILVTPAYGWLRRKFEDAVIVSRSEVILIGRLKPESIQTLRQVRKGNNHGGSWEFHASLIVSEVLKGKLEEKEIPIVIHYGLTPVKKTNDNVQNNQPLSPIEIYDTGNSAESFKPLVPDASQNHIWFLRKGLRRKHISGSSLPDYFGITDPEDIQDIKHKDYFLAYLSKEPEKTVRDFVEKYPVYKQRAKKYFTHFEIQRIFEKPKVEERISELLPFYSNHMSRWNGIDLVEQEYKRFPREATPALLKLFRSLRSEVPEARGAQGYGKPLWDVYCQQCSEQSLRKDIICLLRDMRSPGTVDICYEVLENAHRYWDRIEQFPETAMTELRYGKENEPKVPLPQDSIYYEVEYAAYASWTCGVNSTKLIPLLLRTRDRWKDKDFGDQRPTKAIQTTLIRLWPRVFIGYWIW